MSVSYTVNGGTAIRDYRCKKSDKKPIKGVPNGSTLVYIDDQRSGVMFFDADEKCWIDKDGAKWTQ